MKNSGLFKTAFFLGFTVLILISFSAALSRLDTARQSEGKAQLEKILRRTAAACYAAEGVYPPSLEYMQEHYGIRIGEGYAVHYDIFASNLMPDITVLEVIK